MPNKLQDHLLSQVTKPKTPSNLSPIGWWIFLVVVACIDAVQIILDFLFGSGAIINRLVDVAVGIFIFLMLLINSYRFDLSDILILAGSFLAEEIPLVDIGPFWTYDVWRMRKKDLARKNSAI